MRRYIGFFSASLLINLIAVAWIAHAWPSGYSVTPMIDLVFEDGNGSLFQDAKGVATDIPASSLETHGLSGEQVKLRTVEKPAGDKGISDKKPSAPIESEKADEHQLVAINDSEKVLPSPSESHPLENNGHRQETVDAGNGTTGPKNEKENSNVNGTTQKNSFSATAEVGKNNGETSEGSGHGSGTSSGIASSGDKETGTSGNGAGESGHKAGSNGGNSSSEKAGSDAVIIKYIEPVYPNEAHQKGWEGTVVLALTVDIKGRVTKVEIASSSGYDILDMAAAKAAKNWRYKPFMRNGELVAGYIKHTIRFKLT